jgi:prepilin-type N-terminal cleavage/methylation domain-containing protein
MKKDIKKAFTLVELLVVIAIIALLLSILMPSLQKAKQQARIIQCGANLHQVGLIYQLYSNDYRAWIPRFADTSTSPSDWGKDNGIDQPIDRVYPFLIDATLFDYVKKTYGTKDNFGVCPILVSGGGKLGFFVPPYANLKQNKLPRHGIYPNPYYLGIARLNSLVNMTSGSPKTVADSAISPYRDSSGKLLAADLNIRWAVVPTADSGGSWAAGNTVISHLGKQLSGVSIPLGGNKLQVDLSVRWVKPDTMAIEPSTNTIAPIDLRRGGKYKHGGARDYYW